VVERRGGRWRQARNRRYLASHPLCSSCEAAGRIEAALEVDHRTPLHLGGSEDGTNLQGLCLACHLAKSAAEATARSSGG
jgi:5-methylcytosine-specific restriction enzyme A